MLLVAIGGPTAAGVAVGGGPAAGAAGEPDREAGAAADSDDEIPTIQVRGRPFPLDGRRLPGNLTPKEQIQVFVAALRARNRAAFEALRDEEAPDWVPIEGFAAVWCTQSNPGYGGCSGHHDEPAVDLGVPTGTPIRAAGPGMVVAAEENGGGRGTFIDLLHPDGSSSHYYHLSVLQVAPGQVVGRGEQIALSGSTGRSTAPHLHYEERGRDGRPRPVGPMYGWVGGTKVSYPLGPFGMAWSDVVYGTVIANQGYQRSLEADRPIRGDLDGDGTSDRARGTLSPAAITPGLSASPD